MADYKQQAEKLLRDWKGDNYAFGVDCLGKAADFAAGYGKKASLWWPISAPRLAGG